MGELEGTSGPLGEGRKEGRKGTKGGGRWGPVMNYEGKLSVVWLVLSKARSSPDDFPIVCVDNRSG